jgi:hypothetical protein
MAHSQGSTNKAGWRELMKIILFAAAALAFVGNVARAEGLNAVEMPGGISRPIMAGQSGTDSGSQRMPVFSGVTQHSPANPVISDVSSEAMPVWSPVRPVALARK